MILPGILFLLVGVILPPAFLVWLSGRLNRPPAPRPRQVGLWLAFNFVLPIGLILAGLQLIAPRAAASPAVREAAATALIGGCLLAIGIIVERAAARRGRQTGGGHGR